MRAHIEGEMPAVSNRLTRASVSPSAKGARSASPAALPAERSSRPSRSAKAVAISTASQTATTQHPRGTSTRSISRIACPRSVKNIGHLLDQSPLLGRRVYVADHVNVDEWHRIISSWCSRSLSDRNVGTSTA
jgi:hypothetical protein